MGDEDRSLEKVDQEIEALTKTPEQGIARPPARPPGVSGPADASGINYLVMNCVVPGLGSLLRGNKGVGAAQLGLAIFGVLLLLTGHWVLGPFVAFVGWIWSVISGFGLFKQKSDW